MRSLLSVLIFVFAFMFSAKAQESLIVYPKPIRFEKTNGQLFTNAVIVYKGIKEDLSIELNGKVVSFKTELDSLKVKLPLIGNKSDLVFKQKGQVIKSQVFFPYIPSDWNYFKNGTIDIISSSHQDIAWMNTPDYCRTERIDKIIKPAMNMMKGSLDFKFGMEQTLNLMELVNHDSAYKGLAIKTYKSGQFGWGATFNQPYEGMESSEQLVRQLYLGKKWMKDNFNGQIDSYTAFNMDVPGRTPQFPQILQKAGVKNLFISRFKEGFYNWYSPDGSKVFTYSPGNYGWAVMFYKYFDDDAATAMHKLHEVLKNWNEYYSSRNIPPHYAVVISNDAAGPLFYQEVLKEWNEIIKVSGLQIPTLKYSTPDQFLNSVNVPEAKIDSISGERPNLWLYIHGTAHYEAIKAKRAAAIHLPASEMFNTIAGVLDNSFAAYPKKQFDTAWYKSLYPDHGWGGKNGDITDSIFRSYLEEGNQIALQTLYPALNKIAVKVNTRKPNPYIVFNDLSWGRKALVVLPLKDTGVKYIVQDATGVVIPSQIIRNADSVSLAFVTNEVPAVGYGTYYLAKTTNNVRDHTVALSNAFENEYYKIEFGNGGIKKLYDKQLKQDLLNTTRFAGGDILDLGYDGLDAGEFTEITPANMKQFDKFSNHTSSWTVTAKGPVLTTFECRYQINDVDYIQRITVYNQLKKIDFEYEILNWIGVKGRQLSFALPINSNTATISYDVPMGIATVHQSELQSRPGGWAWDGTYSQKPEEIHPRESQNFVTASGNNFGLTLSSSLAVFDWIDPTRDAVSYPVLQAVMLTSQKSCHGEGPWYYQKGKHTFRFSITSHQPGWKNGFAFGIGNNHALYSLVPVADNKGVLPEQLSFFKSSSPYSLITAIKKSDSDDEVIVRVVNMDNKFATNTIKLFKNISRLKKSSLIEDAGETLKINGSEIKMPLNKSSIETFKIGLINKNNKLAQ